MASNAALAPDPHLKATLGLLWDGLGLSGRIAAWSVLATAIAGLSLLAAILAMHMVNTRAAFRRERLSREWLAWLLAQDSSPEDLRVEDRDLQDFMKTWLHLLESLRGEFRDRLVSLLALTGLPGRLTARLPKAGTAERILSMETLGSLGDRSCIELLRPMVRDPDPILSLHAATALVSIDPHGLLDELLPHFLWREDWPISRVHAFLKDAPQDIVQHQVSAAILGAGTACPLRALRLLDLLSHEIRAQVLRTLLRSPDPAPDASETLLLAAIRDPAQADLARDRIRHPRWTVLAAAVDALGRVGNPDDIPALSDLLEHPQWWVRYRAAGAIAALPQLKPIQVELLAASQRDPLAGEMLRFALSERSLA
ncbi:MAG TPA: HEAT repeat domain-containing protein [Fibrobacteria bacterium]|nr:HEAT repeat domain-containing protein [Fibrobacteria bacterium]